MIIRTKKWVHVLLFTGIIAISVWFFYSRNSEVPVHGDYRSELVLAHEYFVSGEFERARNILLKLSKAHKDDANIWTILGLYTGAKAYANDGITVINAQLLDEASIYLNHAYELNGSLDQLTLLTYAAYLTDLKRFGRAVELFRVGFNGNDIRMHPKYRYFIVNYAEALYELSDFDELQKEFDKSIKATNYDFEIIKSYMDYLALINNDSSIVNLYSEYVDRKGISSELNNHMCWLLNSLGSQYVARDCN